MDHLDRRHLVGWMPSAADYYTLLRFLRARNYEFDKAVRMWMDTLDWRGEYEVDGILDNFMFHEREQFLMAYPQGYHKTDKLVSTDRTSTRLICKHRQDKRPAVATWLC